MSTMTSYNSDLALFDFKPGRIMMEGQRFLLINANALGTLRRDLIANLGWERAKGFLLRYGWSCGYRDALTMKKRYPNASYDFLNEKGPSMHRVEGVTDGVTYEFRYDLEKKTFTMSGIWINSYEVEQHISNFGISDSSVCWTIIGYASGYSTGLFGMHIVYKEITCIGKGDEHCFYIGKTIEEWGDEIADELHYYNETKIAEELEEAYHRIRQQNDLLHKITEFHEKLNLMVLAGDDRQVIVETIGKMLGAPVIVEDRSNRPLVWWIPEHAKMELEQCLIGSAAKQHPKVRSWLQKIVHDKRSLDWHWDEQVPEMLPRTTAPILLGKEFIGYISVIHIDGAHEELRQTITERAAAVIGLDLLKERIKIETEHRLKGEFIDELLDESKPIWSLKNRALYLGFDLEKPHRFILIEMAFPGTQTRKEEEQERFLKMRKKLFDAVYAVLNNVAMIVERQQGVLVLTNDYQDLSCIEKKVRQIRSRVKEALGNIPVSICVSRDIPALESLRAAYSECHNILQVMTQSGRVGEVFYVEKLKALDLLGTSPERLIAHSKLILGELLNYEQQYGGELIRTLYVFLSNECNMRQTARLMNMSLSGMKYRMERICEIGGINLDDPEERFNIHLALKILISKGMIRFNNDG